jgi:hypothetical protein
MVLTQVTVQPNRFESDVFGPARLCTRGSAFTLFPHTITNHTSLTYSSPVECLSTFGATGRTKFTLPQRLEFGRSLRSIYPIDPVRSPDRTSAFSESGEALCRLAFPIVIQSGVIDLVAASLFGAADERGRRLDLRAVHLYQVA